MAYLTAKLPRNDCLWTPRDGGLFHRSTSWVPLLWGALRLLPPMLDHHRYFDNGSTILVKQIAWDVFRWRRENCDQHRSLVWSDRPKDQVLLVPLLCNLTNCTFWYKTFLTLALIASASKIANCKKCAVSGNFAQLSLSRVLSDWAGSRRGCNILCSHHHHHHCSSGRSTLGITTQVLWNDTSCPQRECSFESTHMCTV